VDGERAAHYRRTHPSRLDGACIDNGSERRNFYAGRSTPGIGGVLSVRGCTDCRDKI